MVFDIRHRFTGLVLFKSETASTLREAVLEAISARANLAGANLAGADLAGANLAGADLADANLAGANLADAYLAGADLAGADLARANLAGADLARADLAGANLAGADLADADLAGADLAGANLAGAYLAGADLADAYLEKARGLPAGLEAKDPPEPYVRQNVTSSEGRAARAQRYRESHPDVPVVESLDRKILDAITTGGGSLNMLNWHTCATTHCMGGWAVHLAGQAGYDLEKRFAEVHGNRAPEFAGRAIYLASTGRAPHFFATDERAIESLKRRVEESEQPATQPEGAT